MHQSYCASFNPQDYVNSATPNTPKLPGGVNNIQKMFEKKFAFIKDENWVLPTVDKLFTAAVYDVPQLQTLKTRLNGCKSKLNDYPIREWASHTRRRNPAGEIPWKVRSELDGEFVTQAWCKLYECLCVYPLISKGLTELNSLHLCEAPGAFVTAMNHYLQLNCADIKWQWCAATLNPYHEGNPLSNTVIDDRFILYSLDNWDFGVDLTGNIMNMRNINRLKGKFPFTNLITADGSINCFDDPGHQEEKVSALHFTETVAALKILSPGGNFLLKKFTFFEHSSVTLMYLLVNCFEKVFVFKPASSKSGNSEVYVICLTFLNIFDDDETHYLDKIFENKSNSEHAMFSLDEIPPSFMSQLEKCSTNFMNFQLDAIESNIVTFNKEMKSNKKQQNIRSEVWQEYLRRYALRKIAPENTILYQKNFVQRSFSNRPAYNCSYSERRCIKMLSKPERIQSLREEFVELHAVHVGEVFPISYQYNVADDFGIPTFSHIYLGVAVKQIVSSKFVPIETLQFYLEVLENFRQNAAPESKFFEIQKLTTRIFLRVDIHQFYAIDDYDQFEKELVFSVAEMVLSTQHLDILVFENLPLLTHFIVGFVQFLSRYVFQEVQFYPAGGTIQFSKRRRLCDESLQMFIRLREKYCIAGEGNNGESRHGLLGFVNIPELYELMFFSHVQNLNKFLCIKYCDVILMK